MRLSKFLSLSVALSRNQANFFVRKGRLAVDGKVVTDPYFEVSDTNEVVFDGNPISIAQYRYILLHKPAGYSCSETANPGHRSVLELLGDTAADRYYYFANTLAPEVTGLLLLSDDARWTNRMQRKLPNKQRVYRAEFASAINAAELQQIKDAWLLVNEQEQGSMIDLQQTDAQTLLLTLGNVSSRKIQELFTAQNLTPQALHLQQFGRLSLGDLKAGEFAEMAEDKANV